MKRREHLCIVFWDMGLGGIQKRIRDIVVDISKHHKNWNVYILLRRRVNEGFDDQISGYDRVTVRYYQTEAPVRIPLGFIFWIVWQYFTIKPDTTLTFQCMLSTVLVVCKYLFFWIPTKLVLNEGAVTSKVLKWERISYCKLLIRLTYPLANKIIVPTDACRNDLTRNFSIANEKIVIIPNWTLFPPFRPLRHIFDFVYIGRFDPEKNPLSMIQLTKTLLSKHPHLRVGMIGHGSLRSNLVEVINHEQLGQHVHVMPFSQNISESIRHSKILVVPSHNEGMPNVVLEAAMCTVPAVVNKFLGAEEVIKHGKTGYIYGSLDEAVGYTDKLLTQAHQRILLGQNAQKFVSANFTYKVQHNFINTLIS